MSLPGEVHQLALRTGTAGRWAVPGMTSMPSRISLWPGMTLNGRTFSSRTGRPSFESM